MKAIEEAVFVKSAAGLADFPTDRLPEVALVGRSNVGKSSLINALTRRRLARTSAAPGKTRLANLYRIVRGADAPFYLVDLPGYGYARGGADASREFDELTRGFFGRRSPGRAGQAPAGLLLVDARHPGLEADVAAWRWLLDAADGAAIVATKIDKLARGQRIRAMKQMEYVFASPVMPVSSATGEGLDELWKLIDTLANNPSRPSRSPRRKGAAPPPRPRKN